MSLACKLITNDRKIDLIEREEQLEQCGQEQNQGGQERVRMTFISTFHLTSICYPSNCPAVPSCATETRRDQSTVDTKAGIVCL